MPDSSENLPIVDYDLFRKVLTALEATYPSRLRMCQIPCLAELGMENAVRPMMYLREHGLVDMAIDRYLGGAVSFGKITITARGIDFLRSDGGLSALAGPVVRIAPESLAAVIDAALAARGVPASKRSLVQQGLRVAGAEGIKTAVRMLVEAGIAHIPDIGNLLTSLAKNIP